jgi:hypothetical protein
VENACNWGAPPMKHAKIPMNMMESERTTGVLIKGEIRMTIPAMILRTERKTFQRMLIRSIKRLPRVNKSPTNQYAFGKVIKWRVAIFEVVRTLKPMMK